MIFLVFPACGVGFLTSYFIVFDTSSSALVQRVQSGDAGVASDGASVGVAGADVGASAGITSWHALGGVISKPPLLFKRRPETS